MLPWLDKSYLSTGTDTHKAIKGNPEHQDNKLNDLKTWHQLLSPIALVLGVGGEGTWQRQSSPWINTSENVNAIIATLLSAHWGSDTHNPEAWLLNVKSAIQEGAYLDKSLMSVVACCKGLGGKDIAVNFLLMVNLMQLITKCQSIKIQTGLSLNGIYNQEIAYLSNKPSKRTFQDWYFTGSKFAALAGGGSIYLLVLIASLGLRVSVAAMEGISPWDLENLLRMPKKGTVKGNLIINHIIPTISRMHFSLPISMASMFSPAILAEHQLANEFDRTNISSSDHFFDSVIFNHVIPFQLPTNFLENQGDDTPAEILPLMLEREDRRCTNYSQMIPYLSKEIKDDSTIYQTIKVVFADLFHWIHDVIELQLPEEYELLAEVTSILPGINLSPIFPFLSLVINLNVSTKGHRDSKDKDFCLVLPIGNFQGGALVMVETEILKCTADTLEEEDEGEDAPLPPSQKHRHRREVVDDQDEENDTNMVQTPPSTQPRSCGPIDNKDEDGGGDDDTNTEEFRNTVRGDSEQEEKDDGNHSQMQGRKDAQQADNIGESTSTPSCLPSAALSIQPSSCTSSTAMASVSPSSAMTRKHKPTLALFPPSFAQLAIEAHTQMRLHISTNEGFPASNIHSDISWQIITESSKIGNSFESKLREIEENEALKIFMMDYVWSSGP
ncbi:hypothetical protein SERLADRAFT_434123 [Serpula lacrymans var. lacrymans S7.9]|uniref:Uncharacterized protein n=1 Tax=Serpula lacrymans var. lacrymans (strain S7.9) TaxID=578457 RepID=F8NJN1_SERL9|nr:uncharacterized protein SERLADRAFT_434123 [Serpula lacrymans var. lacrymans S7.9]EGO28246.1 hypothetical protein SERLADRAFT_434123 [Serpula lacrymans var. lacrymans S7.9]